MLICKCIPPQKLSFSSKKHRYLTNYIVASSSLPTQPPYIHPTNPIPTDYDAIFVLGGGLTSSGGLPPWVTRRLDAAAHIYSLQQPLSTSSSPFSSYQSTPRTKLHPNGQSKPPITLLGAGTPHKPPVIRQETNHILHESTAYADYLIKHHSISPTDLLKESASYDTVGNAYFSLTMHAIPAGWSKLAIVTSEFHMLRTRATFDFVYNLAVDQGLLLMCRNEGKERNSDGISTDDNGHKKVLQLELEYHAVSDQGLFDQEILQARSIKETAAVDTWHNNMKSIKTMKQLHAWIFATHLCYSASRQDEFGPGREDLDPKLAATY